MYTSIRSKGKRRNRRAVVLVLAAILLVVMFAFLAFAVDLGFIALTHTQLQNAADSAALAAAAYVPTNMDDATNEAKEFASYGDGGGKQVENESVNVEFGTWDIDLRVFTSSPIPGNAVRVTVERDTGKGGKIPLFFGPILGQNNFESRASAVAMTNPRDIVFVVDLSGSMNNDTEPCWATSEINLTFGPEGYPTVGDELMQQVFSDFNLDRKST